MKLLTRVLTIVATITVVFFASADARASQSPPGLRGPAATAVLPASEGPDNALFGTNAGAALTTGVENTFIGVGAGKSDTTGGSNLFTGASAGFLNTTGGSNTFVGASTGVNNQTGGSNTFIGSESGFTNVGGANNTFLGFMAGNANLSGGDNTFIGTNAGLLNASGAGNVFLGKAAGGAETTSNKLYVANSNTATPLIYGEFDNAILAVNGKLGVGTKAPKTQMQVGAGTVNPLTAGATLLLEQNSVATSMVMKSNLGPEMFLYEDQNNGLMGTATSTPFGLRSNNVGRMWITQTGNIGIGNSFSDPQHLLQLNNNQGAFSDGNTWSNASSRSLKTNFQPVDPRSVLEKLASLPVDAWNYKNDAAATHLGPTAEDFSAAFGLGSSDTSISTVDEAGVSLAAIKGLYQELQEKDTTIATLQSRVASLEARLSAFDSLEARIAALERAGK